MARRQWHPSQSRISGEAFGNPQKAASPTFGLYQPARTIGTALLPQFRIRAIHRVCVRRLRHRSSRVQFCRSQPILRNRYMFSTSSLPIPCPRASGSTRSNRSRAVFWCTASSTRKAHPANLPFNSAIHARSRVGVCCLRYITGRLRYQCFELLIPAIFFRVHNRMTIDDPANVADLRRTEHDCRRTNHSLAILSTVIHIVVIL